MDKERYRDFYKKSQPEYNNPVEQEYYDPQRERTKKKSASGIVLGIISVSLSLVSCTISLMAISVSGNSKKTEIITQEVDEEYLNSLVESYVDSAMANNEKMYVKAEEPIYTEKESEQDEDPEVIEIKEETKNKDKDTENKKENSQALSNIFYVGDVLETKKIKLSYISCGDYADDNMFVEAGENNKLIYFEFEFENIGSTDTSVGYYDFDCYADGYEAKNSMCTADNAMTSIATLSPGRRMGGIVVFEVPQSSQNIELEYETNFWTQDKAIFIYK